VNTERYSLQPATTSSSGDENPGHNHAMLDGVREVKLHGCHVVKGMAIGQRCPEKLHKAIAFNQSSILGKVSFIGKLFQGGMHQANQNLNWCNMSFINC
jgi:hypothetical protein